MGSSQQAQANQMNAQIAQQQSWLDFGGTIAKAAGSGKNNIFTSKPV